MRIIKVWWCLDGSVRAECLWPNGRITEELLGWSLIRNLWCDEEEPAELTELPF